LGIVWENLSSRLSLYPKIREILGSCEIGTYYVESVPAVSAPDYRKISSKDRRRTRWLSNNEL